MSKEIAQTILAQLGGARFRLFTGAHSFTYDGPALIFRLPRNPRSVTAMRITLTPADLYKVEALGIRGGTVKVKASLDDVYCDQLASTFEEFTGLYTGFLGQSDFTQEA